MTHPKSSQPIPPHPFETKRPPCTQRARGLSVRAQFTPVSLELGADALRHETEPTVRPAPPGRLPSFYFRDRHPRPLSARNPYTPGTTLPDRHAQSVCPSSFLATITAATFAVHLPNRASAAAVRVASSLLRCRRVVDTACIPASSAPTLPSAPQVRYGHERTQNKRMKIRSRLQYDSTTTTTVLYPRAITVLHDETQPPGS